MGKGDKKSKRGKIVIGTYGVRRLKRKKNLKMAAKTELPEEATKKKRAADVEGKDRKSVV